MAAAPAAGTFRIVPEAEWVPVVGPRLRPGSRVISAVWQGAFGQSPRGMLAFYRLKDELRAVLVENGKSFHTPALGPTHHLFSEFKGMEILDINGDGRSEVLALATYTPGAGPSREDFYENAVIVWTGATLVKHTAWSDRVAAAKTFQDARVKLGLPAGPMD